MSLSRRLSARGASEAPKAANTAGKSALATPRAVDANPFRGLGGRRVKRVPDEARPHVFARESAGHMRCEGAEPCDEPSSRPKESPRQTGDLLPMTSRLSPRLGPRKEELVVIVASWSLVDKESMTCFRRCAIKHALPGSSASIRAEAPSLVSEARSAASLVEDWPSSAHGHGCGVSTSTGEVQREEASPGELASREQLLR